MSSLPGWRWTFLASLALSLGAPEAGPGGTGAGPVAAAAPDGTRPAELPCPPELSDPTVPLPPGGWGRCLAFAGRVWRARRSETPTGAGPNHWSDAPGSVQVDAQGRLQLTLEERGGRWYGVELVTPLEPGWPTLELDLEMPGFADDHVIFGAFLYRDDRREIDLELGRWGEPGAPSAQFVLVDQPLRRWRFQLPPGRSQHHLRWAPGDLDFCSQAEDQPAVRWGVEGVAVPHPQEHRLHLNLWLYRGAPATAPAQVTIEAVRVRVTPFQDGTGPPFDPPSTAPCVSFPNETHPADGVTPTAHELLLPSP